MVVYNFSHTAIVVGKTKKGQIVGLGGNQRGLDSGKNGWYLNLGKAKESLVVCFTKPKSYDVTGNLEKLPILTVEGGELGHENTH